MLILFEAAPTRGTRGMMALLFMKNSKSMGIGANISGQTNRSPIHSLNPITSPPNTLRRIKGMYQ
mgnify:CR=1 FL=1